MQENTNILKYKTGWFLCRVTTNKEKEVYRNLKQLSQNEYWSKYIYDMFLPMRKTTDKAGKTTTEIIPDLKGIIYIKMALTDEVYSVIRVNHFRGPIPPKNPVPLREDEVRKIMKYRVEEVEE